MYLSPNNLNHYIFFLFQIIYDINFNFVEELKKRIGLDYDRLSRMSIVEEAAVKVPLETS